MMYMASPGFSWNGNYSMIDRRSMGTDPIDQTASVVSQEAAKPINWVRLAMVMAVGFGAFALYRAAKGQPVIPNMLAPWPAIGPMFAYADGIGRAFSLTPFVV
jgi:hypothetical protein